LNSDKVGILVGNKKIRVENKKLGKNEYHGGWYFVGKIWMACLITHFENWNKNLSFILGLLSIHLLTTACNQAYYLCFSLGGFFKLTKNSPNQVWINSFFRGFFCFWSFQTQTEISKYLFSSAVAYSNYSRCLNNKTIYIFHRKISLRHHLYKITFNWICNFAVFLAL